MAKSRFGPEIDLDGVSPDEAFAILGHEVRTDIVRVLWHAGAAREYDDVYDTKDRMAFSELRRRVDVDDNGKFNYHLSKLTPHFVRQDEEGYRLSGAGKRIARTVIAVSGPDQSDLSADLERDCPLCGAAMTATYEDQWLRVQCTECAGLFGDETPQGTVYFSNYPAAGLAERSPEEAVSTGLFRCLLDQAYMMRGVCRECAGPISASVSVCDAHATDDGGPCPACGTEFQVWAEQRCETCRFAKRLPVEIVVMGLTPVIGFLDDHGVDVLAPSFAEIVGLLEGRFETDVTTDPLCVSVTVHGEERALAVSLDEEMNVLDVDRSRRP